MRMDRRFDEDRGVGWKLTAEIRAWVPEDTDDGIAALGRASGRAEGRSTCEPS